MKRVGKRGEGKFERISWDEALDTISDNLRRILKDYGNEAVHVLYGTGVDGGNITNSNVPYRLMNSCGGFLSRYGSYSTAQISAAMSYMFGANDGNSPDDIANTKLVVMFGNNPAETRMSGGGVTYYVEQARERSNARMIVIDPRYNDTAAGREDEWLPIRPGTDGALKTWSISHFSTNIVLVTMKKRCPPTHHVTRIIKPIFWAKGLTA